MMHKVLLPLLLATTFAACGSVATTHARAVAAAQQDATARAAAPAPLDGPADDAVVAAAVADLLDRELTDADAVRVALLNNRDVRAGYERLGIGAADLVQAGLLRNPVFGADALVLFDGGTDAGFVLAQPFLDLFWRPLRTRRAGYELEAATAAVTRELVRLAFSVRRAIVRVRAAQQLADAQRRVLAAATAAHDLMQQLADAGNVVGAQLSAARVAEGRARLELAAAERAAREAREPLNVLLGVWGRHVAWRVAGALPAAATEGIDLAGLEARSVAASLDLRENRARIDAAAQAARITEWRRWLPAAVIGVGAEREAGDGWAMGPSASAELPLFDTGAAQSAAAGSRLRLLLHRHAQLAVEVRAAARLLHERLDLLEQRAHFLADELLPAQEQLLRATLQDYNAMQIGVFDVIVQKQQQLAAVREQVTTLRDAWLARLDLEELLAGSLPDGARAPWWPDADSPTTDTDRGGI